MDLGFSFLKSIFVPWFHSANCVIEIKEENFLEEGLVNLYTSLPNSRTVSPVVIVKKTSISWINGIS